MAKQYILQFGNTLYSGLTPTFTVFKVVPGGGATTPPGVTEIPSSSGLYYFTYEPAAAIAFNIDGGSALSSITRYIAGALDPVQAVDERITELGTSLTALSSSLSILGASLVQPILNILGTTNSSFGTTLVDPSTVIGYLRRLQEFDEGNSIFTKTSGTWAIFARGNATGASTGLVQKTITDSGSVITKV